MKVTRVNLLLFRLMQASSIRVVMASVVERPGRNPNCLFESNRGGIYGQSVLRFFLEVGAKKVGAKKLVSIPRRLRDC